MTFCSKSVTTIATPTEMIAATGIDQSWTRDAWRTSPPM